MILLLFIWNLMASDIFIQGQNISDLAYEKKVLEAGQGMTFINHLAKPNPKRESQLRNQFKQAQFEFLQGSLEVAKKQFNEILDLALKNNWSPELQKTLHYCFLRAAQLEKSKDQKYRLLKNAILFHPSLSPNTKLFPPPLVQTYQSIKNSIPIQIWTLPGEAQQFSKILINGRPLESPSTFFRYRKGEVRLSFLSNKFQPVHIVTQLEDLKGHKISQQLLAQGSCTDPQFDINSALNERFRLIEENCESRPLPTIQASTGNQALKPKPQGTQQIKILNNKWFWIGVSALAAGVAISANHQNNKGNNNPSTANSGPQEFSNN